MRMPASSKASNKSLNFIVDCYNNPAPSNRMNKYQNEPPPQAPRNGRNYQQLPPPPPLPPAPKKQPEKQNKNYYFNKKFKDSNTSITSDVSPICDMKICQSKSVDKPTEEVDDISDLMIGDEECSELDFEEDSLEPKNLAVPEKLPDKTETLTVVAVEEKSVQTLGNNVTNSSTQTNIVGSELEAQLKKLQKKTSSPTAEEGKDSNSEATKIPRSKMSSKDRKVNEERQEKVLSSLVACKSVLKINYLFFSEENRNM